MDIYINQKKKPKKTVKYYIWTVKYVEFNHIYSPYPFGDELCHLMSGQFHNNNFTCNSAALYAEFSSTRLSGGLGNCLLLTAPLTL